MRTIKIVGRLRGCFASLAMTVCFVAALLAMTTVVAWGQTYKPEKNKVEFRNNTRFKVSPYAVPAVADSGLVTKLQLEAAIPDTVSMKRYIHGPAGVMAKFAPGDTTITPATAGTDYLSRTKMASKDINIFRKLGSNVITWPLHCFPGTYFFTLSNRLAVFAVLEPIEKDTTITGVSYFLRTAGDYTGNNYNGIAVYELSGSNWSKVAETTNNTEFWKATALTKTDVAFASTFTMSSDKLYCICLIYSQSAEQTAPVLYNRAVSTNVDSAGELYLGTGIKMFFTKSSQTSAAATYTTSEGTKYNISPFIILY